MSYYRANPSASSTNALMFPAVSTPSGTSKTVGTDTGTKNSIAINATLTAVSIDGTSYTYTALGLTAPVFTVAAETSGQIDADVTDFIVAAMLAAGYTNIDNLSVTVTNAGGTPNVFTCAITHTGEATLTSFTIGGIS